MATYKDTILISEQTLKQESLINDNVDALYIKPAVQASQDMYLQPLIGTVLLNKLQKLVFDNEIGLQANEMYKVLLDDYVTKFLVYKVMSEIQVPLSYKLRNFGAVTTSGENISVATKSDVQTLIEYYDQRASFYANRMTDWLCANSANIPEYHHTNTIADMQADNKAYNTGIFFRK